MVLSNKKLKEKLRSAKAVLITVSGAQNNFTDKNNEKSQAFISKASASLNTIQNLQAQLSKSSKRERPKRVKQKRKALTENTDIIKNGEISVDVELKLQDGLNSDAMQEKKVKKRKNDESEVSENVKKKRKKKRDEGEASENVNKKRDGSEAPENVKRKKNKKKKRPRQWWMIKKRTNDKKKVEEENGAVKEESNQDESGSTAEQLVAKADVSVESDRNNIETSQKVYVGGIPYYSNEDDIRSYFEGCGTITYIDCMTFPDTGKFRGIAFITFKTEAAAKRALALDGSDMGGFFLKIQPFKSASKNKSPNFAPSVAEGYNRIYVGNLAWDITETDLKNALAGCTIKSIRFGEDKETGEFKGYAHVDFADSLSLKTALKLDQTVVCGRPIRISCAVKKGTASESKSMPKDNQVDTRKEATAPSFDAVPPDNYRVKEVAAANLKAPQEDYQYQVSSYNVSVPVENEVASSVTNAVSSKIRRRTCYECGERGHLSSSCPKKQAADATNPGTT